MKGSSYRFTLMASWLTAFAILYGWMDVTIWFLALQQKVPDKEMNSAAASMLHNYHCGVLLIVCVIYGLVRFYRRFPGTRPHYSTWLKTTPWTSRLPLPLGPLQLSWTDGVLLAGAAVVAKYSAQLYPAIPLIAFGIAYLTLAMLCLAATKRPAAIFLAVGLVGILRVWDSPLFVLALLAVLYALFLLALPASLDRCSWLGEEGSPKPIFVPMGWPFDSLRAEPPPGNGRLTGRQILLASILCGWFAYCLVFQIAASNDAQPLELGTAIVWGGAILAFLRFVSRFAGRLPPISILGRIATGNFFIPRYDQIFLAPLCICATAIGLAGARALVSFSDPVLAGISATVLGAMALGLPPSPNRWRLTGGYRMIARVNRQQPPKRYPPLISV
jgi:hypothetical protein